LKSLIEDLKKANRRLKGAITLKPTRIHKDAAIQSSNLLLSLPGKLFEPMLGTRVVTVKVQKIAFGKARLEIIDKPEDWFEFLREKNLTAHICNEKMADRIYKTALKFPKEVDKLLQKLLNNFK